MYWLPKTKIGKISFWTAVAAFAVIYLQYWFAMIFNTSVFVPGFLAVLCVIVAGVTSVIAITKNHDHAYLLFFSVLLGALGVLFVLGELLFPH